MTFKVFDAHCDTLTNLSKNERLENFGGMVSGEMLRAYPAYVQVFAAYLNAEYENPLARAMEIADVFYRETAKCGMVPILNGETLSKTIEEGGVGAILSMEDGRGLCGSLSVLRMLYRLGFRLITLTWNGENELGQGAVGSEGKGLTPFGKEVVSEMNRLGMMVDVSHLSERGFWDTMEITKKPTIASHSNAKAICDHPRNLSDEQIRALIKNGGGIGINFYTVFLNGTEKAEISDVIRHIEHILSLGGADALGLGSDFDGIGTAPEGLGTARGMQLLFDALARLGYKEELIEKIAYKNFVRIFKSAFSAE
ncbi:MAG: dipeptidase [Clostridia bacterium]|nr:dipeptidase [Clostridia bacterium]